MNLGNPLEANAELEKITAKNRAYRRITQHPEHQNRPKRKRSRSRGKGHQSQDGKDHEAEVEYDRVPMGLPI